jgi:2-aminoadipate transaminase
MISNGIIYYGWHTAFVLEGFSMQIKIDRESKTAIYMQIVNSIKDMIMKGYIPEGYKLPPERKLSEELGINRSTVLNAYNELKAQGLIESKIGYGTIVTSTIQKTARNSVVNPETFQWKQFFSDSAARAQEAASIDILKFANRNDTISFAAGISNTGSDPLNTFAEIQEELIKTRGHEIFKVTPTQGIFELRESLRDFMKGRYISAEIDEIMILSGSQQGIELTARTLVKPGDVVFVEDPTFFCALQVFKSLGARVMGVPIDKDGIRTDILEIMLKRHRPSLIYTMPTFHNPTGCVMSLDRRKQLLNIAYKYQIPIIEDDPYCELRYEGESLPPIKSFDSYGYVIYLSSFSKIMFQGLRVGWMIAPNSFIKHITLVKQMADLHSSSLPQWILGSFYRKGLVKKHIEFLKDDFKIRRDIMLKELDTQAPKELTWNKPEGGIYIWCNLNKNVDEDILKLKAAENKVAFLPGSICYPENNQSTCMRLNFTFTSIDVIKDGVKRLSATISETLEDENKIDTYENSEIRPLI